MASDCIEFTFKPDNDGYGRVRVNGKKVRAHRLAYIAVHGHVEPWLHVMHTCDNPRCVNPAHLVVGTHQDNMRDMTEKGRRVITGNAKLDPGKVRAIREAAQDGATYHQLARAYGVSEGTIGCVVRKESWQSV